MPIACTLPGIFLVETHHHDASVATGQYVVIAGFVGTCRMFCSSFKLASACVHEQKIRYGARRHTVSVLHVAYVGFPPWSSLLPL